MIRVSVRVSVRVSARVNATVRIRVWHATSLSLFIWRLEGGSSIESDQCGV